MMENLIDLHIHILPGIDDGSQNMETSLHMADIAVRSGVRHMAVTPHSFPGVYDNYVTEELIHLYEELQKQVYEEGMPLHLYHGMEIFGNENTPEDLEKGRVWTFNDTRYFLVEFSFDEEREYCDEILQACSTKGYMPVIAHPERYYFVQDRPQIVYDWYTKGYGIQVNKGSLTGDFGKREKHTAHRLLRHGVVSYVSTDAHNTRTRTPSYTRMEEELKRYYDEDYAYMLMHENPSRILQGIDLVRYKPISFEGEEE